jgi:hypothetical protein
MAPDFYYSIEQLNNKLNSAILQAFFKIRPRQVIMFFQLVLGHSVVEIASAKGATY